MEAPKYAHTTDAGLDLRAAESLTIDAGKQAIVKTGIKMAIPEGYVGLIWDRSGLAAKHSMHALAGVIDAGYRGEIGIVLRNLGDDSFDVEKGMRIAQLLIQPVLQATLVQVDELSDTSRSGGGFGSTGLR